MKWTTLTAVALLARDSAAQNMLRFACSQLVVERSDPLIMPGVYPTPHVHQIVGGNSFNVSMPIGSHDLATQSTCSSCSFPQDKSNYWTAAMYFRDRQGRYKRVPQIGNGGPQGQLINDGGLAMYYIPSGSTTAFAPGFRMFAGSAVETNVNNVNRGNICHRCWNAPSEGTFVGGAPCTGSDTVAIPNSMDCYYIRQTVIFPACWDGVNLDSPNHRDHVTYSGTGASGGGACPSSHPVKLPQIMYEIMFDVREFRDANLRPTDGSNPFMLAMGIGGSATHGDYMFGWEGTTLQRAMDNGCNLNAACPSAGLTFQQPAQYNACKKAQVSPETVDGWLDCLPGYPDTCRSGGNPGITTTASVSQPTGGTTVRPPTTTAQPPTNCAAKWGQCGGQGWSGATCCQSGSTCQAQNQWYSQCL